ncbi:MAG: hypothetical protein IPJ77_02390 [Planctomycetes bacterium]|nr:hypothetical protein [Planctomycetota bacterium]
MNLKQTLTFAAVAGLAAAAVAWQLSITPVYKNPLPKHLAGNWLLDKEMTIKLAPESRLAKFGSLSFTNDTNVLDKLSNVADRLKDKNLIMAGMLTIDGNTHPYVIHEKEGCSTLIWFHQGVDTKVGDPVAKCINLILAADSTNDMLFLGDETGLRNSSVCYKRK